MPCRFASAAMLTVLFVGSAVQAQAPATASARLVRSAPVRVGRLVSAPVLDAVGSFSPLPDSQLVNIFGLVQTHRGVLLPKAGLVLVRDLQTAKVAGSIEVDERAQFALRGVPPGLYVAELVGRGGQVLATTAAFSAAAGEVVHISQTVPDRELEGVWRTISSATSTALSAAASTGILAIAPGVPVTPGK